MEQLMVHKRLMLKSNMGKFIQTESTETHADKGSCSRTKHENMSTHYSPN